MIHPDSGKYEYDFGDFLEKSERQLGRNISCIEKHPWCLDELCLNGYRWDKYS